MANWSVYWNRETATRAVGKPVDHVASDRFHEAGVDVGDHMFVITYREGVLHVITSMVVAHLVSRSEAEEILGHGQLWDARWHVIARPASVRRATLSATLAEEEIAALVFIGRDGRRARPARNRFGLIDPQTFRTPRRIDARSAAVLEKSLSGGGQNSP